MKDSILKKFSPDTFAKWYPYVLATFVGYALSDLVILSIRPSMLPTKAPPHKPPAPITQVQEPRGSYNSIISRNIFNWDGTIKDPLQSKDKDKNGPAKEEIPILSQLPLTLIGTIVHSDAKKSVATIEVKSKNLVMSFRNNTEIEGLATITKIERGLVVFRNLNTNGLEYIETQSKNKISFKGSAAAPTPIREEPSEVQKVGENQFQLKRSDLLKYTNNLAGLLQQARSVPNRNPKTGEVDGFRILDFQPGTIFEKLGIQRNDVIKGVNGEPVDSPAKAMELYNALKSSDKVNLTIERHGKNETMEYQIK